MSTIAERLLELRGHTKQGDFAAALQVNPNTLRSYENGRSLPNQDFLERVCVQFSVSPAWLLLGQGPMHIGEASSQPKDVKTRSSKPKTCPEESCRRCSQLETELEMERRERRKLTEETRQLSAENRQLYQERLDQEKLIGELRLALQSAKGVPASIGALDYAQNAPTITPPNS